MARRAQWGPVKGSLARPDGGAAGGAGVRERLRVGLHHACGAELRGRRPGGHPVVLPAGLPADRRHLASRRPRPGGGGRRARPPAVGRLLPCRAPHDQPGCARRVPAGRAARAGGVRRPAAAELPDPDHLDPRPVPLHLQRTGRRFAGGGARRVLRGAGRARAVRRGSSTPRPRGCRRSARRRGHVALAVAGPGRWRRAPDGGAAGAGGPARQPGPLDGARHVHVVPRRRPRGRHPVHRRTGARRGRAGGGGRRPACLARGAPPRLARDVPRAQHLHRELAARDRRGARPGDRDDPAPTRRCTRPCRCSWSAT